MRREPSRRIALALLLSFSSSVVRAGAPPAPTATEESRPSALAVPILKIPGRLTVDWIDDPKPVGEYLGETFRDPKTYVKGGFVLALSALTVELAHIMPGPPLLRTAVGLSGAFLGWELGRLDPKSIDWTSQLVEISAASGAYLLAQHMIGAAGILAGGWPAGIAAVGAAITSHFLLHRFVLKKEQAPTSLEAASAGVEAQAVTRPGVGEPVDLTEARTRWLADMARFRDAPTGSNLEVVRASEVRLRQLLDSWRLGEPAPGAAPAR